MSKKPRFQKPVKKQTMAEQMAETIQESILSGQLESGAILPTEPELASQFGVSRAVVRDATRILMARGLVDVKHGRGVFVTHPNNNAFSEALLLALRRVAATAWDVEQFEQIMFPEIIALAATNITGEELGNLQQLTQEYINVITDYHTNWWKKEPPAAELEQLMTTYRQLMLAIFNATHNRVFQQLAQPLLNLRNLRNWAEPAEATSEIMIEMETGFIRQLIDSIAGQNPVQARATTRQLMELPTEAITAMQQTPVGEIAQIPVPLPTPRR